MKLREKFIKKAKAGIKEAGEKKDAYLANVERTLEAIDEVVNILAEKLEDWYSLYFPELRSEDKAQYAYIVLAIDDKKNIDAAALREVAGKNAERIAEMGKRSSGAEEFDLSEPKKLAAEIVSLAQLRSHYEKTIEEIAKEICPNATEIAGGRIVAMLIAHAGSLERLSKMPASTLQVLGAEKALFKHLRSRAKIPPPKHGILFLHQWISKAPKKVRGKLARTIAAKLAIAFKVDYGKGKFIGDKLREQIDKRRRELLK
ncbi:MAG: NOP5/NOP56 family protein [Candidatus Anstonellales archaeon]